MYYALHKCEGLGNKPGELATLRRAGHTLHTPDLFEGRTFDTIDAGVSFAEEVGFAEVIQRGVAVAEQRSSALFF